MNSRRHFRALAASTAFSLAALVGPQVTSPAAAAATVSVSVKVLVLDDGSPMVDAVRQRLVAEGQPVTVVDLASTSRPQLTEAFLAVDIPGGLRANYMAVVMPNEAPTQLSDTERATLDAYQRSFKVRSFAAYTWASPAVGLNYAANPGHVGAVDGMRASLTPAATSGAFAYLRGTITLDDLSPDVDESWGYLATPAAATDTSHFSPLLTATIPGTEVQGSLLGVHTRDGVERMVSTFASNQSQQHWKVLSHGIVTWLTRGVSLTHNRNYLSVHIDDILLPDALWSPEGNCTIGDGCDPVKYPETAPDATVRMVPSDVTRLVNWQRRQGIKLDMTFNAKGAADEAAASGRPDELEAALLGAKAEMRWINHTYSHPYLGCVQDFSTVPWRCATTATGAIQWVPSSTINAEIARNNSYATTHALPGYRKDSLVTGEHSGLRTLPQMVDDNPNLASSLTRNGVKWVASDASREHAPRTIGSASTVPRYPMNIFYNTSTRLQAVDEYNWIYTSAAKGGSDTCTQNPATTTCIEPLDPATGFDSHIVPLESRIALGHALGNDPRPHYAHASNLAEEGLLYPVLDDLLATYRQTFADTAPVVNPSLAEAGAALVKQATWRASQPSVTASVSGRTLTLGNTSTAAQSVPVTLPGGSTTAAGAAFGEAYAGQQSAFATVAAGATTRFTATIDPGFATTATWPAVTEAPVEVVPAQRTDVTAEVPVPVADSDVVEATADKSAHTSSRGLAKGKRAGRAIGRGQ